jgi:alpha-mannosidase
VHADLATFEIQFGSLQRPTHRNTTWDLAKDEVAAHKFADLSQADYGAALLNDSKYGYKVKDGVIDLNLLRSVPYPRPTPGALPPPPGEPDFNFTDQAEHSLRYAFYPHAGDVKQGKVVQAGYEFNHPLQIVAIRKPASPSASLPPAGSILAAGSTPAAGSTHAAASFLQVDAPNVIVETVKAAEDGQGWIVRLYECAHASARATLHFGIPVHSASETDLLERELQKLPVEGNSIQLEFKPFEIKTVRVR